MECAFLDTEPRPHDLEGRSRDPEGRPRDRECSFLDTECRPHDPEGQFLNKEDGFLGAERELIWLVALEYQRLS